MPEIKDLVSRIRSKPYYTKLLDILILNGLLDIVTKEAEDNKINYPVLVINVIDFLVSNKKLYKNFTQDTFEKILILSIDEILSKKFEVEIEEEELFIVLKLVKNSWIFKSTVRTIKDFFIRLYYKTSIRCNKKSNDKIEEEQPQIINHQINLERDKI